MITRLKLKKTGWFMFLALLTLTGKAQSPDTLRVNLETALQIALSDNPLIQIADLEIKRVDYSRKEAWHGLIPALSGAASLSKFALPAQMVMIGSKMDSPADLNGSATLTLSLPLVVPALWRSIQMTELQMQMANEQVRSSKITLRNEVTKAYYQILLAQDSYHTLQEGYELARQNYEEAKQRFNLGLAAEYDYISAEVQMQNLIPNISQVENGIVQAKSYLKVLMGVNLSIPVSVEGKLTDFERNIVRLVNLNDISLSNNSDLMQLDIQQQQLQKQFELQRTQRIPTLAGFAQYGYSLSHSKHVIMNLGGMDIDMPARKDLLPDGLIVGLQLNVPIFSGFTKVLKEKQIKVSSKALAIQRSYVEDQLNLQIAVANDNMTKAVEQMDASKKGILLAEKGYTISQERYNNGMGTMLELRSSSQALTQAKLSYNQAIADYLAAKADYEKVTGKL
jgi:outer membrane protein TolC